MISTQSKLQEIQQSNQQRLCKAIIYIMMIDTLYWIWVDASYGDPAVYLDLTYAGLLGLTLYLIVKRLVLPAFAVFVLTTAVFMGYFSTIPDYKTVMPMYWVWSFPLVAKFIDDDQLTARWVGMIFYGVVMFATLAFGVGDNYSETELSLFSIYDVITLPYLVGSLVWLFHYKGKLQQEAFQAALSFEKAAAESERNQQLNAQLDAKNKALTEVTDALNQTQKMGRIGAVKTNLLTGERWFSEGVKLLFGYEPDEPFDRDTWIKHIHEDDRPWVLDSLKKIVEEKDLSITSLKYRIVTKTGEIRFIEVAWHCEFTSSGEPHLLLGHVQDVTDQ